MYTNIAPTLAYQYIGPNDMCRNNGFILTHKGTILLFMHHIILHHIIFVD